MSDPVNHPSHYVTNDSEVFRGECIDFSSDMPFCQGNAFKYVWRAGMKDDEAQDLSKAAFYLGYLLAEWDKHDSRLYQNTLIEHLGSPCTWRDAILTNIARGTYDSLDMAYRLVRTLNHNNIQITQEMYQL